MEDMIYYILIYIEVAREYTFRQTYNLDFKCLVPLKNVLKHPWKSEESFWLLLMSNLL